MLYPTSETCLIYSLVLQGFLSFYHVFADVLLALQRQRLEGIHIRAQLAQWADFLCVCACVHAPGPVMTEQRGSGAHTYPDAHSTTDTSLSSIRIQHGWEHSFYNTCQSIDPSLALSLERDVNMGPVKGSRRTTFMSISHTGAQQVTGLSGRAYNMIRNNGGM